MLRKRIVELSAVETSFTSKCQKLTDAEMHVTEGVDCKGLAEELLKGTLSRLLVCKSDASFPFKCLNTVRSEIAPVLNGCNNKRDTLLLKAESGPGRNMGLVLLLAAAVMTCGYSKLIDERQQYDASRVVSTRSWIAWAKQTRRSSKCLSQHSTARWSSIKHAFDDVTEDPIAELDAAIVECFLKHPDAISIATLEDEDITCECCNIAYVRCRLAFYNCPACEIDFCAECEQRRVNFK
jgi:hypothetical protein